MGHRISRILSILCVATPLWMGVPLQGGGVAPLHAATVSSYQRSQAFYLTDHLGSTRLVTDESGIEQARYAYYPFGELFAPPPRGEGGGEGEVSYLYTGQELDRTTELYYYGARYYDPALGRFLSLDPLNDSDVPRRNEDPGRFNRYSYTKSNPVIYIDPNGKWEEWFHYALTVEVATRLGYSKQEVAEIAYFAVRVDNVSFNPKGNFSVIPLLGVPSVHFPGGWSIFSPLYNRKIAALSKNQQLGLRAHQAQDYIAHRNFYLGGLFEPVIQAIQHFVLGKWFYPDDPARRPDDARRAAEETILTLLEKDPRFKNLSPEEKKRTLARVMQGMERRGFFDKERLDAFRSMADFVKEYIEKQDLSPDEQRKVYEWWFFGFKKIGKCQTRSGLKQGDQQI